MASYHMNGEGLVWFQDAKHSIDNWGSFMEALQTRFVPTSYDDHMEPHKS
jgi:hypothetical protein